MTQQQDPIFDQWGQPRYGFCPHGEANGFCDRGGCDEFWVHQHETEANPYTARTATERQVNYLRSLISTREIHTSTPANNTSLRRYLGDGSRSVDQASEWVHVPNDNAQTICYLTLDRFIAHRDEVIATGTKATTASVSDLIAAYLTFSKKGATAPTVDSDEEATPKQKGFIKSLVTKRQVPDEVLAKVEEAFLSKAKASQLIGLLTALPERHNA